MKYSTDSWDLVQAFQSAPAASCKTPVIPIDPICRNNQARRNKRSSKKIKLPTNCMVFPWLIYTESRDVVGHIQLLCSSLIVIGFCFRNKKLSAATYQQINTNKSCESGHYQDLKDLT